MKMKGESHGILSTQTENCLSLVVWREEGILSENKRNYKQMLIADFSERTQARKPRKFDQKFSSPARNIRLKNSSTEDRRICRKDRAVCPDPTLPVTPLYGHNKASIKKIGTMKIEVLPLGVGGACHRRANFTVSAKAGEPHPPPSPCPLATPLGQYTTANCELDMCLYVLFQVRQVTLTKR